MIRKTLMFLWLAAHPLAAEISLAPLFQDGAVLQRDMPVPVWGRANPGSKVTVGFAGQKETTTADSGGAWMISLRPMTASREGREMTVSATDQANAIIKEIWVGEIWLASGQSNMQWSVAQARKEDQDEAAAGPVPGLRLFQVPRTLSPVRQESVDAKWSDATPESARSFSAVGYFFGKILAKELNVPIGIIHSSWGGSRIEPWWAEEGLEGISELGELRKRRLERSPGFQPFDTAFAGYLDATERWLESTRKAMKLGLVRPEAPKAPEMLKLGHNQETGTYQAMIHPLVPYALRGMLWYQGESNNGEGMQYTAKMRALIAGWRKQFRVAEAPFLFVQLAPYQYGANLADHALPEIWAAQQAALTIPHTGMAVTNDIGAPANIHPGNKSEVARRLSLWALADTYGRKDLVKSGPLFTDAVFRDGRVQVKFDHTGSGLKTRDGKTPSHFEIAGDDGNFRPAVAEISADGTSLSLLSQEVPDPKQARFAWSQVAEPNLMNAEGLPAGAFHTRLNAGSPTSVPAR